MTQSRFGLRCLVVACAGLGLTSMFGCLAGPAARPKPAPTPPPTSPAAPSPAAAKPAAVASLDPREERQLTKDLVRDVDQYYLLLKDKAVEDAAAYVDPSFRRAYQDELWTFVANYAIESAHVLSYQLYPQVDGVMAKVKVARTLFDKGSVVPKKSEVWMTWIRKEGRWIIRPQEQK